VIKRKVTDDTRPVVGVVGAEARKFLPVWETWARRRILESITGARLVVSGRSPLGGIDLWAIEEAQKLGIPTKEFPPETNNWAGFKARNVQIAEASDIVICIAVRKYHHLYRGRRFDLCYHCKSKTHVKSGGCWTMHLAQKLGKEGRLIIVGE
jgi:hypothetical protein